MSRQIKFRAWDKKNEIYLCNVQDACGTAWESVKYDDVKNESYDESCFGDFLDNKRYDVEQYTGLKDANCKEIYEGDILAWHSNIYRKHDWVGLVLYRGAGFVVQESSRSFSTPDWLETACNKDANIIEVIGNIHENPELLEESNE